MVIIGDTFLRSKQKKFLDRRLLPRDISKECIFIKLDNSQKYFLIVFVSLWNMHFYRFSYCEFGALSYFILQLTYIFNLCIYNAKLATHACRSYKQKMNACMI